MARCFWVSLSMPFFTASWSSKCTFISSGWGEGASCQIIPHFRRLASSRDMLWMRLFVRRNTAIILDADAHAKPQVLSVFLLDTMNTVFDFVYLYTSLILHFSTCRLSLAIPPVLKAPRRPCVSSKCNLGQALSIFRRVRALTPFSVFATGELDQRFKNRTAIMLVRSQLDRRCRFTAQQAVLTSSPGRDCGYGSIILRMARENFDE
jgi:hypothetical protein